MGYIITIEESTCYLPRNKADKAYKILCDLNFNNKLKGGGRYANEGQTPNNVPHPSRWFDWMDWNYHEKCKDVQDIFEALGFEIEEDDDKIHIIYYEGKSGSQELFFKAIGNLLRGEIAWCGEDGEKWKWKFGPKGMKVLIGKITFEEE